MSKTFDILVAGEINPDLILSGDVVPSFGQVEKLVDSASLAVGSSSAIFACGAARLGLKTAFIGLCGDDVFGRFMLDEMQRLGVNVSNVVVLPGKQTGLSVILNRSSAHGTGPNPSSERAILTHAGLISSLKAGDVTEDLLRQSRHLHVGSYFLQTALQPGLPDLFARARSLGLTTSLDPNWDPSGEWQALEGLLREVDVFLPNENEALALTGSVSVDVAINDLRQKCRTVALKLGAQGALACRGEETAHASALKLQVVDTIGAGDSFDAGFLYGFLKGWSLEKALSLAVACGSLSTRAAGGTSAQPTLEEAMRHG
ncbi:MAG: carbohydrate kinase family protein [Anaerolineales bacterium]